LQHDSEQLLAQVKSKQLRLSILQGRVNRHKKAQHDTETSMVALNERRAQISTTLNNELKAQRKLIKVRNNRLNDLRNAWKEKESHTSNTMMEDRNKLLIEFNKRKNIGESELNQVKQDLLNMKNALHDARQSRIRAIEETRILKIGIELMSESLSMLREHKLHSAIEREFLSQESDLSHLRNFVSHLQAEKVLLLENEARACAQRNILKKAMINQKKLDDISDRVENWQKRGSPIKECDTKTDESTSSLGSAPSARPPPPPPPPKYAVASLTAEKEAKKSQKASQAKNGANLVKTFDLNCCRKIFDAMDRNNHGEVNVRDLIITIRRDSKISELFNIEQDTCQEGNVHTLQEIFNQIDANHNHAISWLEFEGYFSSHKFDQETKSMIKKQDKQEQKQEQQQQQAMVVYSPDPQRNNSSAKLLQQNSNSDNSMISSANNIQLQNLLNKVITDVSTSKTSTSLALLSVPKERPPPRPPPTAPESSGSMVVKSPTFRSQQQFSKSPKQLLSSSSLKDSPRTRPPPPPPTKKKFFLLKKPLENKSSNPLSNNTTATPTLEDGTTKNRRSTINMLFGS
jgi:hypothetical protein